jgi:hypothetical protein
MESSVFSDISPCSPLKFKPPSSELLSKLRDCCLLGLLYLDNPEDAIGMFLLDVG